MVTEVLPSSAVLPVDAGNHALLQFADMYGLHDLVACYFDVMWSQITPRKVKNNVGCHMQSAAVQFLELAVHYQVDRAIGMAADKFARNPNCFQDEDSYEPSFIVEGETQDESMDGSFYKLSPEAATAVLAQDSLETRGCRQCQEDELVEVVNMWARKNPLQAHRVCELLNSLRLDLLSFSKLMALSDRLPSFEALGGAQNQLVDGIAKAMKAKLATSGIEQLEVKSRKRNYTVVPDATTEDRSRKLICTVFVAS
eukprot:TRINITY_DN77396_c0_g1_i1.p1 TRINITY_DN77396_c0_g1~~TRINITY_DN77396_c0_g1_i1.p1  ORF type:complete len:255 (-),score=56.74 TRINITY_DN77396_c0_g1_i1:170-934(-)